MDHRGSVTPWRRRQAMMKTCGSLSILLCGMVQVAAQGSHPDGTWLVSMDSNGVEANNTSYLNAISDDGRIVAFGSDASNLVPGDTNGALDVFVHDRMTLTTTRVSVSSAGLQANRDCFLGNVSGDGRYVVYWSASPVLVSGDTNGVADVFVHDRTTGITKRVSVGQKGQQANYGAGWGYLSGDGRWVVFSSASTNLVKNDNNGYGDIFVRDLLAETNYRVSVDSAGGESNNHSYLAAISWDASAVVFESAASNLVKGDSNGCRDIFVHWMATGITNMVSVSTTGTQADWDCRYPSINEDGRFVAFQSPATTLVPADSNGVDDIFWHDTVSGVTLRASVDMAGGDPDSVSSLPSLCGCGLHVAFGSGASDLVPGDTNQVGDVFVRDLSQGVTSRISIDSSGQEANRGSGGPAASRDCRLVAFASSASNLVPGADNPGNMFVHGDYLTFEAIPENPAPGVSLSLTFWGGAPMTSSIVAVVDVNGAPVFFPVIRYRTDGSGNWTLSGPTPPGYSGNSVVLVAIGFAPPGWVDLTNREMIRFQ